jgi:hypothetical protein
MQKILVTGSRDLDDPMRVLKAFDEVVEDWDWTSVYLIHGAAGGADTLARVIVDDRGGLTKGYPADWGQHGKAAGPIRNQEMVDLGGFDICLAFPGPDSTGTWDCVKRAVKAGVPVNIR